LTGKPSEADEWPQLRANQIIPLRFGSEPVIVADNSHYQTLDVLFAVAQKRPYQERFSRSNKGTLNHLVQARFDKSVTNETDYQPYKGTDKPITALLSITIDPARPYTNVTLQQKGDVQLLEVAMEKRHPNTPNAPTFRELKFDRLDGAYRSIAMQKQYARTSQTHDLKIICLFQQRRSVFLEKTISWLRANLYRLCRPSSPGGIGNNPSSSNVLPCQNVVATRHQPIAAWRCDG